MTKHRVKPLEGIRHHQYDGNNEAFCFPAGLPEAFKEAVDGLPEDITEGLTVVEIEEDGADEAV